MGNAIRKFIFKMLTNILKSLTGVGQTKMVIIVRTDLGMGRGKIASQAAHAAVSLYDSALKTSNTYLKTWLRYGQPKIVLKVDVNGQEILRKTYQSALDAKLNVCAIYDAGKTQIASGTLTAVGIGPNLSDDVDKITKDFKLL